MLKLASMVLAATLLAACARPAAEADPAAVEREVKAAIRTQVEAYASRDLDKLMSVMAPDYVWLNHGQPNMTGLPRVRGAIASQLADPALALSIADESVEVAKAGDMAVFQATYNYRYTDPASKKPAVELGNWVAIFRRQPDGTMKLTRDIIVDLPPKVAPAK